MKTQIFLNMTPEAQEEFDGAPNGIVPFGALVSAAHRIKNKNRLSGGVRDGKFYVQMDVEVLRTLIAEHRRFSPVSGEEASEEIERSWRRLEACKLGNRFLDLSEPTLVLENAMRDLTAFYGEGRTQFLPALEKACEAANLAEKETIASLVCIAEALLRKTSDPFVAEQVDVDTKRALARKGPRSVAELSRICDRLRKTDSRKRPEAPAKAEPTVTVDGNRKTISIGPNR